MKLVEIDNFELKPTQEALLIKPIRDLFTKDRSKSKERFFQQLSFLYHYVDPRSSYNYIVDEQERFNKIVEQEGLGSDFKIDSLLQKAIDAYKERVITTSYLLLQDGRVAVDKVRQFLREVDLLALDDKGKPIYTVNTITTAIKQLPQLAKDLLETEKAIAKEIAENGRARGSNVKTLMDDDILI